MVDTDGQGESEKTRAEDEAAASLADDLRQAICRLVDDEIPLAHLERASQLARALREELVGPRRPRWYDASSPAGDPTGPARRSYLFQSPIRGRANPVAPPLVAQGWSREPDGRLVLEASATLGAAYEGPPHGVHGGIVAALFDDLLGQAQQQVKKAGVTAKLEIKYRHITPLDEPLRFRAWIHEDRGRWVAARATCHAGETLTADAEAVFIGVDFEELRGRMASRKGGDADSESV